MAAVAAGLMMLAFALATGTRTTYGQTPGATATAVRTGTPAATTPAGTPTVATTPVGTPTRGALTPAVTPTSAAVLPSTGTGPGPDSGNSTAIWVAGAGIILAIVGGTFVVAGVRRR